MYFVPREHLAVGLVFGGAPAMRASSAMHETLGEEFVKLYCALKEEEYRQFQEIVTPWEREILMLNV